MRENDGNPIYPNATASEANNFCPVGRIVDVVPESRAKAPKASEGKLAPLTQFNISVLVQSRVPTVVDALYIGISSQKSIVTISLSSHMTLNN